MQLINRFLDHARDFVRSLVRRLAATLNSLTGGRLHPSAITFTGLLMHLPIAWLIATTRYDVLAAGLLVVFGLFDALDGELARLQKRASNAGMLLDASTDRMKEVILYTGVLSALLNTTGTTYPELAVVALGGSLLVSYIKAKGETAVKDMRLSPNEINRLFQDGLARFEIRMTLLVIGLLTGQLGIAVAIIAILSWLTAFSRLRSISKKLL